MDTLLEWDEVLQEKVSKIKKINKSRQWYLNDLLSKKKSSPPMLKPSIFRDIGNDWFTQEQILEKIKILHITTNQIRENYKKNPGLPLICCDVDGVIIATEAKSRESKWYHWLKENCDFVEQQDKKGSGDNNNILFRVPGWELVIVACLRLGFQFHFLSSAIQPIAKGRIDPLYESVKALYSTTTDKLEQQNQQQDPSDIQVQGRESTMWLVTEHRTIKDGRVFIPENKNWIMVDDLDLVSRKGKKNLLLVSDREIENFQTTSHSGIMSRKYMSRTHMSRTHKKIVWIHPYYTLGVLATCIRKYNKTSGNQCIEDFLPETNFARANHHTWLRYVIHGLKTLYKLGLLHENVLLEPRIKEIFDKNSRNQNHQHDVNSQLRKLLRQIVVVY